MALPCGKCLPCALARARSWALRCVHESALHLANEFVTLTYADEHLPPRGTLCLRDMQLFFKRLRKNTGQKLKYFYCGEYGPTGGRPHYHAIIFGLDLQDKVPFGGSQTHPTFTSEVLTASWGLGHVLTGEVTFESAAYVAGYTLKKAASGVQTKYPAHLAPEFVQMSRRPGIGAAWLESNLRDVYPSSLIVHEGSKYGVPRYYDKLAEKVIPDEVAMVREDRRKLAAAKPLSFRRRQAGLAIARARQALFKKRPLDQAGKQERSND